MSHSRIFSSRTDDGFTLLEMLVVTVVFGLLSVALWEGLSVGTRGWTQERKHHDISVEMADLDSALRRIVARAELSDPDLPPALSGTEDRLRLISWLPENNGFQHDIEAGLGINGDHEFVLRWKGFQRAQCVDANPAFHEEVLARDIRAVSFSYYGRKGDVHGWQNSWTKPDLPLLIKIHIVFLNHNRSWPDIYIRPLLSGMES